MGTYTAQSGDTITSIAANFGVTLAALEAANPQIPKLNRLSVGQVLTLLGVSTPSLTTGSSAHGIYNPVANIAAASQYIISHYQVSLDGSDFAAKVQQADPNRPPLGY